MPKKTPATEETKKTSSWTTKSKPAKTSKEKTDADTSKVLKANELGGGGFLSGLWFSQKTTTPIIEQDDDYEEVIIPKKIKEIEKKEPVIAKPRSDFLSHVMSGKPDVISSPKKAEEQPIIKQEGEKKEFKKPDLSFFDGVKRYEQPKKPQTAYPQRPQTAGHRPEVKPIIPAPKKIEKIATTSANLVKKQEIIIEDKITVKEFSEKMGVPLPQVMKKLMENKIMTSVTASLDFDTALLIAEELGVIVKRKDHQLNLETFMSDDLQSLLAVDKDAEFKESRPPIVTIMGHVDHGKTSLLDYLRKTVVAEGEAWGITQSIWASVVDYEGKKVCFIDTPGHELFTSLRARGAKLTNIAVIVVAADDSVMPQTIESIGHAKESWVPIIIAVTKIDKPGKNIDQIKQDLAKYEIIPEDWGWNVPVIWVSSKTGQGIPELLETILLQAEIMDLQFNPKRAAAGVILDAHKDPKQGVVSTIIVMTGTLHVGDIIVAYNTYGKVRRMQNWKWQNITKAVGGEPVQILGITSLPDPGRILEVVKSEKEAQQKVALIQEQAKKSSPESAIQQFLTGLKSWAKEAELRLILKSDGSSSLEALKQAIAGIQLPKSVTIKVIHTDVGHFNDSDISLGQASGALLIGFNITLNALLKKKAENLKIEMKSFDIIYELIDYINNLVQGMIEIEKHEVAIGKLEVLGIFYSKGKEMVIGGKIIEGKVKNKLKFRILRGEEIIGNGEIISLHKNKDEVKEMNEGEECGMKILSGKKIEMNDLLEFLEMQDVKD